MDRKLQRHRADSLRQHGFLVILCLDSFIPTSLYIFAAAYGKILHFFTNNLLTPQKQKKVDCIGGHTIHL